MEHIFEDFKEPDVNQKKMRFDAINKEHEMQIKQRFWHRIWQTSVNDLKMA